MSLKLVLVRSAMMAWLILNVAAQHSIQIDMRNDNVTYSWPGSPPTSAYNYNYGRGFYSAQCGGAGAENMQNYQDTVIIHFQGSNPIINFLGTYLGGTANIYLDGNFIHQANVYAPGVTGDDCEILPFPFYADPGDHVVSITVFPDGDPVRIRDFWYTSLPPAESGESGSPTGSNHSKIIIGAAVGGGAGVVLCILGLISLYRGYRRRQTNLAYRNAGPANVESAGAAQEPLMATVGRQSRTSLGYASEYTTGGVPGVATNNFTGPYSYGNQRSTSAINRPLPSPPPPGAAPAQQPSFHSTDYSEGLSYSQLQQSGMFSPAQLEILKGLLSSNAPRSSVGNIIGMMLREGQAGSSGSQMRTASPDASSISRATKPTVSTSSSPDLGALAPRTDMGAFSHGRREELPPSYEGNRH